MARISFFSIPEHREFSYKPRYYDPTKEHVKKLEEKYGEEKKSKEHYIPGMAIRKAYHSGDITGKRSNSNGTFLKRIMIFVTLIILFLAAYYLAMGFGFLLK